MPDGATGLRFSSVAFCIKRNGRDTPSSVCRGRRAQGRVLGIPAGVSLPAAPVHGANALVHPRGRGGAASAEPLAPLWVGQ